MKVSSDISYVNISKDLKYRKIKNCIISTTKYYSVSILMHNIISLDHSNHMPNKITKKNYIVKYL